MTSSSTPDHPLLYEVHTRQWLAELGVPDLAAVSEATLDGLVALGVTHLWLMGVWPTGPRSRQQALALRAEYDAALPDWSEADVAGSPYAVADYRVADDFGGDAALAALRARLARRGIGVILDFVPNHVALDHPWVATEHVVASATEIPDAFREGKRFVAHGKDPFFPGWTDTAQIEYRRQATRAAMRDVLRAIADRCDGIRCDMAMLALTDVFARTWRHVPFDEPATGEFWADAIAHVRRTHPRVLFLAEAYWGLESRLCDLGFDYAYDKDLYDRVVHDRPGDVAPHVYGMADHNRRRAHFLENHDEPRAAALPIDLHRAAALLVMGLPGMRFLHHGQLAGARRFARIQLRRRAVEERDVAIDDLYRQLLPAIAASSVGRGEPQLLVPERAWHDNDTARYFTIVKWPNDLVVVNLAPHRAQCRVIVPGAQGGAWRLDDRLGDEEWIRDGDQMATTGLFLDLPPARGQLFSLQRMR